MVTVVDPRHPLYDQTFPLLHIKNKQELVRSCLVLLTENVERLIPLAMTDLALSPPAVFPVPLAPTRATFAPSPTRKETSWNNTLPLGRVCPTPATSTYPTVQQLW